MGVYLYTDVRCIEESVVRERERGTRDPLEQVMEESRVQVGRARERRDNGTSRAVRMQMSIFAMLWPP